MLDPVPKLTIARENKSDVASKQWSTCFWLSF
jgi:hypothetical protein